MQASLLTSYSSCVLLQSSPGALDAHLLYYVVVWVAGGGGGVVGGAMAGVALAKGLKVVLPQSVSFNTFAGSPRRQTR
jgi:hypothetical protein